MRTHSGRNAHQSPVTSNPPDTSPARTDPRATTDAGRACRLMRDAGCPSTNPSHPDLLAALAEGVTPETLGDTAREAVDARSEEHTSELQPLMRNSYAVFCSKKNTQT